MTTKFKKVSSSEAFELAKKEVNTMEGSGVFSDWYYNSLVNNAKDRFLVNGKPVEVKKCK